MMGDKIIMTRHEVMIDEVRGEKVLPECCLKSRVVACVVVGGGGGGAVIFGVIIICHCDVVVVDMVGCSFNGMSSR